MENKDELEFDVDDIGAILKSNRFSLLLSKFFAPNFFFEFFPLDKRARLIYNTFPLGVYRFRRCGDDRKKQVTGSAV